MVLVKWCGHACVGVVRSDGYTIVFDPHDGASIGLMKPDIKGDLILVSHDHFDHNAVEAVYKQDSRVLREFVGEVVINDIRVRGYESFHDKYEGKRRGLNTIYVVEVEGFRLAHLGDLGHIPKDELLNALKKLNLLIIPVGGTYTIYPEEAWSIITKIEPDNVLPIHYWVRGLNLPLSSIDDFLAYVKNYNVVRLDSDSFRLEDYHKSIIVPKIR